MDHDATAARPRRIGRSTARRQGRHRHRLDQRHRARHRPGTGRGRRRRDAQRLRRGRRRSRGCATSWSVEYGVTVRIIGGRHEPARRDRGMMAEARGDARAGRHPGQQCRHPARRADRRVPAGEVGRDPGDQPVGRLPHHAARPFRPMKAQRLGPDRQHRLGARPGRLAVQGGLRRRQARHGRPDQGHGAGARRSRASPATPSAPATSGRRWSSSRSTTRPGRTASRATR